MAEPGSGRSGGGQDRDDEYVSAVSTSSSFSLHEASKYVTATMEEGQIAAAIEKSREQGWSEVADHVREVAMGASWAGGDLSEEDQLLWKKLKEEAPGTFVDWGERVKLGRLIAEGGQAHIYEAMIGYNGGFAWEGGYVAKVLKMEGFSLADLHSQWPRHKKGFYFEEGFIEIPGLEENTLRKVAFSQRMPQCSVVSCATFLKDGRFAFLAPKCWGDLRTLINLKMKDNNQQGLPFTHDVVLRVMHDIALGMKSLNGSGIVHRDLKAANVLIPAFEGDSRCSRGIRSEGDSRYSRGFRCYVADYESCMLVQGTGFWRAPEVLEDLLKKPRDRNEEIWTEKVDVYAYGMTCYEVLTGHTPFFGYVKSDWKRVIDGERPHLPEYVDPKLRELVERCWYKDPLQRPTFDVIISELFHIQHS